MKIRADHLQKYIATIFQKEYSTYTRAGGSRHDHGKFSGLLHDTILAKQLTSKIAEENEAKKAAEMKKAEESRSIFRFLG